MRDDDDGGGSDGGGRGNAHRGAAPSRRARASREVNDAKDDDDDYATAGRSRVDATETTTTTTTTRKRGRSVDDDDAIDDKVHAWRKASQERSPGGRESDDGFDADVEAAFARALGETEDDEQALIEAQRRRREEILAKHGASKPVQAVTAPVKMVEVQTPTPTSATARGPAKTAGGVTARAKAAEMLATTTVKAANATKDGGGGDMFGEDSDEDALFMNPADVGLGKEEKKSSRAADMSKGLKDNWDDAEGYYCARIGEVLDDRYTITAHLGRGVFSNVLRAVDTKGEGEPEVAIKVIRCNETMYKAAQLEIAILQKLSGSDPENKRHCVKFIRHFEYREHVFMVFESLAMNLREVIKKFGRNVGINIKAVQAYATQLLIALRHLKNCGVVHADIKPDNILVNQSHNLLKMCDFGSAMFDGDNELTPYLVSRFYRAPEVILGLPYSHPMDLWSVGCCLYELFTGNIVFPGRSNNHMLKLMLELKGPVPKKLLRRALFKDNHYDATGVFSVVEEDPVTKQSIRRLIRDAKPTRDLAKILTKDTDMSDVERKKAIQLADLLDKIFNMDPEKRITVVEALQHPFIVERL